MLWIRSAYTHTHTYTHIEICVYIYIYRWYMYIWKYWSRSGMDWHYEPSRIRANTRKCHRWVRESCTGTLGWILRFWSVFRIACLSSTSSTPITVWSGSPSLRRTWNSSGCRCCFYFWVPSSSTTCAPALNIIFGKKKCFIVTSHLPNPINNDPSWDIHTFDATISSSVPPYAIMRLEFYWSHSVKQLKKMGHSDAITSIRQNLGWGTSRKETLI